MRRGTWVWALAAILVATGVSWLVHRSRAPRRLDLVVLDKTVPFRNYLEHRSLFWLLRHEGFVRPDRGFYDPATDYLGAYPPARPGDPPERTQDLTIERAVAADVIYLADTYGVYELDLESGEAMRAALERSPELYGGLRAEEARAAARAVATGKTLVAEFNTLASPTPTEAREILEGVLGVHWTHWIGRYFTHLEDPDEVPQWLRRNYEREWGRRWEFTGPGYVLLYEDAHCEVLRVGEEAEPIGLVLERVRPVESILSDSADEVAYPYWFDVVDTAPATQVLASFRWRLTPAGRRRLEVRGLPATFPAVTLRKSDGGGRGYYFAGDFADNPMPDHAVPFAGYVTWNRWLQRVRLAPSQMAFYWSFYYPMMARIFSDAPRRRS